MTPQDRSKDVSRIYLAARELSDSQRLVYLQGACGEDEALRREVESLLEWNADLAPILAALAGDAAAPALPAVTASTTFGEQAPMPPAGSGKPGDGGFTAGTIFAGRFRIIAPIGRGGMGE